MKEAAGEANMTVITIIIIAVVAAVGVPLIRGVLTNTKKKTCCESAGGTWNNGNCTNGGNAYTACLNQS